MSIYIFNRLIRRTFKNWQFIYPNSFQTGSDQRIITVVHYFRIAQMAPFGQMASGLSKQTGTFLRTAEIRIGKTLTFKHFSLPGNLARIYLDRSIASSSIGKNRLQSLSFSSMNEFESISSHSKLLGRTLPVVDIPYATKKFSSIIIKWNKFLAMRSEKTNVHR